MSCISRVAMSLEKVEIRSSWESASSYRQKIPSRLSTARPPSLPMIPAVSGETTPSSAAPIRGRSKRYGPSVQETSTSSGSRVRRDGTIAISSNP
jgi:hypothetical protein